MAGQPSDSLGGCGGWALGAFVGLTLGAAICGMIAAATTPDLSNKPAAGYYMFPPALAGAAGGGFFGMLVGAVIGGILGSRAARRSAGGRQGPGGRRGEPAQYDKE